MFHDPILIYVISALGGYLFGSIAFGLLLTKIFGAGDLRAIGSGNIGATNVLRTGNKGLALATLILDMGKAGLAALLFAALFDGAASVQGKFIAPSLVAGACALIGHCYPIWLKFKGGKGVATYFGLLFGVYWPAAIIAAITWLVCAFVTRISSLSALLASLLAPLGAFWLGRHDIALITGLLSLLVFWRHRENIGRILAGNESKIGAKSQASDTPAP